MMQKLLGLDTASSAYSFLSERGILSGFYIAALAFGAILGNEKVAINSDVYIWLALTCFIFGLIIANITYEVVLPALKTITDPVLQRSFRKTVGHDLAGKFPNYSEIRKFRESFVAGNGPEHLRAKILNDEDLRLTLTYLTSASIFGYLMLFVGAHFFPVSPWVISLEFLVNSFVFLMTLAGRFPRAAALGEDIGIAYLYTVEQTADKKSIGS
jgi:hypothetical protein